MIAGIYHLARWTALVGGFVLVALVLTVVGSVAGRALIDSGLGPVPGDYELLEVGVGIAVFFFLPWCHLKGGHATVNLFYMHMPRWIQKTVDVISDVSMLAVWGVMTWMLWEGMLEKKAYTETTFILQIPIWWAYAICLVGAVIGCISYATKTLIKMGWVNEPQGWAVDVNVAH